MSRRIRNYLPFSGFSLALILFAAMPVSAGTSTPNAKVNSFCTHPVLVDYERPLKALAPVKELPESDKPPFAPAGIRITALQGGNVRLVSPGQKIHYQIRNEKKTSAHLGWTVKVRIHMAAPDGSAWSPVSESVTTLGELGPRSSELAEGSELTSLGIYRIEIAFFDEAERLLGAYGEYLRAVKPTVRFSLGINRKVAWPGSNVKLRLENRGTLPIDAAYGFEFAYRKQGHWLRLPEQRPVLRASLAVLSGRAGRCETVRIPRQSPPGLYRVRKFVDIDGRPGPAGVERALTATFRVKDVRD
jgi:hypothetical protein